MVKHDSDFGDFTTVLSRAGIVDNSYPIKGCCVWLPDGFDLKERVFSMIEDEVQGEGYRRYQFPRLVPGSAIRKVTEDVDDFEGGVFWLRTKQGDALDIFLNPTGECGVYTMFKKWIREERDLPKKAYQISSTFRPHRRPDALLNGDEFSSLLEAHSAFPSKDEADKEFSDLSRTLDTVHDRMGIPYVALNRPLAGNKPVCIDMLSYETYLPSKRTSFNVGVHYNQGQIYSKAFDVKFNSAQGTKSNTHQVTFGISERGLAAMLDLHRDEYGLRMLPEFSPSQVLVMPVCKSKDDVSEVYAYAEKVADMLKGDYRTELDLSKRKPGKKLAEARMRGIPVRIGVSPEDMQEGTARVYLRTEEEPLSYVRLDDLTGQMGPMMDQIRDSIVSDAQSFLESKICDTNSLDDTHDVVASDMLARMHYCGDLSCLDSLSKRLPGEMLGTDLREQYPGTCLSCGKDVQNPSYYSKRGASP